MIRHELFHRGPVPQIAYADTISGIANIVDEIDILDIYGVMFVFAVARDLDLGPQHLSFGLGIAKGLNFAADYDCQHQVEKQRAHGPDECENSKREPADQPS